jgi:GT2 family glycosyltransferase
MSKNLKKKFSVIIPTIKENKYLLKNLNYLNKQTFKNFEVILISENNLKINFKEFDFKIIIFKKNLFLPGEKRNFGAKHSNGEFLAFIDDDAYPDKNWLLTAKNKIESLKEKNFMLGGPGILPNDDNFFSKIIDLSYRSFIYGNARLRYESIKIKNSFLDDWPSVNMVIEKKIFLNLKGFDVKYWPGEDSKLCDKFVKNKGKIYYMNNMVVRHYRRANLLKHLKQIFRYAFTRGKFFREKDKNSKKIIFTFPSIFMIYIILFFIFKKLILLAPYLIALSVLLSESLFFKSEKNLFVKVVSPFIIILNLFTYGLGFLLSFIFPKYNTKLGR